MRKQPILISYTRMKTIMKFFGLPSGVSAWLTVRKVRSSHAPGNVVKFSMETHHSS